MTKLLKAGELAKKVNVLVTTIRFYTKEGLLKPTALTPGKYNLYDEEEAVFLLKQINTLKKKRFTIEEIKHRINGNGHHK